MKEMLFFAFWIGLGLAFVALMGAGVLWLDSIQCSKRWERSGLQSSFSPIQGCMVQRKDGTWWPASAIRDVAQ